MPRAKDRDELSFYVEWHEPPIVEVRARKIDP
jgi:hypothetical protein